MIGRNGTDDLARFVSVLAFFALIVSFFVWQYPLYIIALVLLVYSYFRMFSKNISKRYKENAEFCTLKRKAKGKFKGIKNYFAQRKQYGKTHKFFKCKACGHTLRVPKGKGKIRVTCPNCKTKFDTKS